MCAFSNNLPHFDTKLPQKRSKLLQNHKTVPHLANKVDFQTLWQKLIILRGNNMGQIGTWQPVQNSAPIRRRRCCGLFLGNSTALLCLFVSQNPNPKSQSTNLAGSLDGAPIITQSRRHKPCSKIEVSYSAHSQLAFDASLLFTDCQRDCDCDLRFARCCAVALRCCAAAVRSHNTTPSLRPRRGLTHRGGRHNVE